MSRYRSPHYCWPTLFNSAPKKFDWLLFVSLIRLYTRPHVYEMVSKHREYKTARDDFVSLVIAHFGFVTVRSQTYITCREWSFVGEKYHNGHVTSLRRFSLAFCSKFDEFVWQTTMTDACNGGILI